MSEIKTHYLLTLEFLGFRFHGWQKQLDTYRTIQGMLERTLFFVLGNQDFKTLGASRTDAMVSSQKHLCKLTLKNQDIDPDDLLHQLNSNLPSDIKIIHLIRTTDELNIINDAKSKTYHYYFCNEFKPSPFIAPFMCNFKTELNFKIMKQAAKIFEGKHSFLRYCYKPNENKQFERTMMKSEITENTFMTASFFPAKTYVYIIQGEGFLRHQVRLMMGAIIMAGEGKLSLEEIKESLEDYSLQTNTKLVSFIAPASGLILHDTHFI